ncbi:MAG: DUF1800 domain-containing protein [Rhodoferax sp.]|nr:DUF1800 domain-containing protein [Rhodoferax sp.]
MQGEESVSSESVTSAVNTAPGSSATVLDAPQKSEAAIWGLSGISATALTGCGGGSDPEPAPQPVAAAAAASVSSPESDAEAVRFLLQASLGARDSEVAQVRSLGYSGWLDQQFLMTPGPSGWDWLAARGYHVTSDTRGFPRSFVLYPADNMLWQQLIASPDPVRRRAALALSEFFVVGMPGLTERIRWPCFMIANWWDMLCQHAFGNFRTLLEAVTLHPAMGLYLNTHGNQGENPATGRVPDENYAREVMQLFSIGLYELNTDGSLRNGVQTETYSSADVSNLARVFTGYLIDERSRGAADTTTVPGDTIYNYDYARLPMYFTASRHSSLDANFLGVSIPGSTPGPQALSTALDRLFNHPNVGPFFGRQMIQRLVTSNPSPAYVARVAAAFNDNGSGVRGDLMAIWRAILLDAEARGASGLSDPGFGKLREPMLRFVQWARTFGVTSVQNSWKLGNFGASLGQGPLRSPSVFNFFRPGYVPPNTVMATTGRVAPEFQLISEQQVMDYLGAMYAPIRNGFNITGASQPENGGTGSTNDIKANYSVELGLAHNAAALLDRLDLMLTGGQLRPDTRAVILGALASPPVNADSTESLKLNRIAAAIFLIMASADYLVQK